MKINAQIQHIKIFFLINEEKALISKIEDLSFSSSFDSLGYDFFHSQGFSESQKLQIILKNFQFLIVSHNTLDHRDHQEHQEHQKHLVHQEHHIILPFRLRIVYKNFDTYDSTTKIIKVNQAFELHTEKIALRLSSSDFYWFYKAQDTFLDQITASKAVIKFSMIDKNIKIIKNYHRVDDLILKSQLIQQEINIYHTGFQFVILVFNHL